MTIFFTFLISHQSTRPNVYLSHQVFDKSNAWAITPVLIDILNKLIKPQTKWLVLCEANSMVNMEKLLEKLAMEGIYLIQLLVLVFIETRKLI